MNDLLTWAAGLIVGDFGGSGGGIFISKLEGSEPGHPGRRGQHPRLSMRPAASLPS